MTYPHPGPFYSQTTGSSNSSYFVPVFQTRDPNSYDTPYSLGQKWINSQTSAEFTLTSFTSFQGVLQATWVLTGGGADVSTLTTQDSTVVLATAGTILIDGASNELTTTGSNNPGTVTISLTSPLTTPGDVNIPGKLTLNNSSSSISSLLDVSGSLSRGDGSSDGIAALVNTTLQTNASLVNPIGINVSSIIDTTTLAGGTGYGILIDPSVTGANGLINMYGIDISPTISAPVSQAVSLQVNLPTGGTNRYAGVLNGRSVVSADSVNSNILEINGSLSANSAGNAAGISLTNTYELNSVGLNNGLGIAVESNINMNSNNTDWTGIYMGPLLNGSFSLLNYVAMDIRGPVISGASSIVNSKTLSVSTAPASSSSYGVYISNAASSTGLGIVSSSSGIGAQITTASTSEDAIQLTNGGIKTTVTSVTAGASPQTCDNRFGQVTFSGVNIAAASTQSFVINNTLISGASTVVFVTMAGSTTGSALNIQSVTPAAGNVTIVVSNGTGATASTANITFTFWVMN